MKSFLQRLFPGVFGEALDRRQTPRANESDRRQGAAAALSGSAPVAAAESGDPATAPPARVNVAARRPLISSAGEIAGFEFRIGEDIVRRLRRRADARGQAAWVCAVLTEARLVAQTGRIGLARVPADWLVHTTEVDAAAGAWVGVEQLGAVNQDPALLQATVQAVQQLRSVGAQVGWDAASDFALAPDFVWLSQGLGPMAVLLASVKTWPPALQGLPTLVTDIANVDDLELALHSGIRYACGALAATGGASEPGETLPVPPEVGRVGYLLKQLVTGAETAVIVSDLKGDVGLSYRLLRRINSASFAQLHAGASIDQAVLMLGRNELYRWLSVLLVQFAGRRKVSSALQEIALWRSRLLELLAVENQAEMPSQLFTLGLASMLGPILKISLDDVVSTLNLPEPGRQALLEKTGPWYVYLQMALQVEAQQLNEASPLAQRFGGVARVLELSDEAWAWAWAAGHADREGARAAAAAPPA